MPRLPTWPGGIAFGRVRALVGNDRFRLTAMPWLVPLGTMSAAQHRLIKVLRFAPPGQCPLPDAPAEILDHAIGTVAALADLRRTRPTALSTSSTGRGVEALLVEDDAHVVAWVGVNGEGVVVGFAPEDPLPFGFPTVGMSGAALIALGWYLDLAVSTNGARSRFYTAVRGRGAIGRSTASAAWERQLQDVINQRRTQTLPHYVRPHVRSYGTRYGTDTARRRAPAAILRLLGPRDTWVRGYWTGTSPDPHSVRENIRRASALADLIGLAERAGTVFGSPV